MEQFEKTNFDLNSFGEDGRFHIHNQRCYVMFPENRAGLGLINRALKLYHHGKKTDSSLDDTSNAFVGTPHTICIVREHLQELRFELL